MKECRTQDFLKNGLNTTLSDSFYWIVRLNFQKQDLPAEQNGSSDIK